MSTLLGIISLISIYFAVYKTYLNSGVAIGRYGASCVLALFFSLTGMILGIWGKNDADSFHLFAYVGIVFNIIAILAVSALLYAGAYGL